MLSSSFRMTANLSDPPIILQVQQDPLDEQQQGQQAHQGAGAAAAAAGAAAAPGDPFSLVRDEIEAVSERLRRSVVTDIPSLEQAAEYFFRAGALVLRAKGVGLEGCNCDRQFLPCVGQRMGALPPSRTASIVRRYWRQQAPQRDLAPSTVLPLRSAVERRGEGRRAAAPHHPAAAAFKSSCR